MNKVIDSLIHFLNNAIPFDFHTDPLVLRIGMEADNLRWQSFARQDGNGRFVMVSKVPVQTGRNQEQSCAELLARINRRLDFGHFEMYHGQDILGFRTVIPLACDAVCHADLIEKAFEAHATVVASFLPTFEAVFAADKPPVEALSEEFSSVSWV